MVFTAKQTSGVCNTTSYLPKHAEKCTQQIKKNQFCFVYINLCASNDSTYHEHRYKVYIVTSRKMSRKRKMQM